MNKSCSESVNRRSVKVASKLITWHMCAFSKSKSLNITSKLQNNNNNNNNNHSKNRSEQLGDRNKQRRQNSHRNVKKNTLNQTRQ